MQDLDVLIYYSLTSDSELMDAVSDRVKSTTFEVSPEETDNTPTPYILVADDGFQNNQGTKDFVWESNEDHVQATIEIAADSPNEVKSLTKQCRQAVENYMVSLAQGGESIPDLQSVSSNGIAWDWTKPCYYTHIIYQANINNEDET